MSRLKRKGNVNRACCLALMLPTGLMLSSACRATEYSLGYAIELDSSYNDNLGLDEQNRDATYGTKLLVPISLQARGSQLRSSANAELTSARFDDSGYDSDDQNINAISDYSFERGSIGVSAGFNRSSTRDTEFLDTGVIGGVATRVETLSYSVRGRMILTERHSVDMSGGVRETEYESPRYTDNESLTGTAAWSYRVSERTAVLLRANIGRFENDGVFGVESTTSGLQIGFNSAISENLKLSLAGGSVYVESDNNNPFFANVQQQSTDDEGYSLNGSLDYKTERSKISATAVRSLYPSGNGFLRESSVATFNYGYKVSEYVSSGLALKGGLISSLDDRQNNDRNFASAKLKLGYQFAQDWKVSGNVTYRYQKQDQADSEVHSTSLGLSIVYQPNRTIWSR